VFHRDEGRPEGRDQAFDLRQELVVACLNLDSDLVDGLRVEPRVLQFPQEPIAIGNARSFDLGDLFHRSYLPAASPGKTRILGH
jgi:hypothetical protein